MHNHIKKKVREKMLATWKTKQQQKTSLFYCRQYEHLIFHVLFFSCLYRFFFAFQACKTSWVSKAFTSLLHNFTDVLTLRTLNECFTCHFVKFLLKTRLKETTREIVLFGAPLWLRGAVVCSVSLWQATRHTCICWPKSRCLCCMFDSFSC